MLIVESYLVVHNLVILELQYITFNSSFENLSSTFFSLQMEMFLSRLNFYEFRVRPLGLFEVSNELILVYFSAVVTYLTYIMQYRMQMYET